ncbi:alpha/beta fold hydrolase [Planctomycetes bacterium Poly30]
MSQPSPLQRFKDALASDRPDEEVACEILALEPSLPDEAIDVMDEYLDWVSPLVQVALIDAYYRMTGCDYHAGDLEAIRRAALASIETDEDVFAAATIALARQEGQSDDSWSDVEIEAVVRRPPRKKAVGIRPPDTITVMIHGTWASDGTWWRKGGDFFEYARRDLGLADLYDRKDAFRWSGSNSDVSRSRAARELGQWLNSHRAASVRVFAHSHGANVASLATQRGAKIDRLVMLSPPVRKDYLPNWRNIRQAYNIQAKFDVVVGIARGGQWFKGLTRSKKIKERKLRVRGHSASHDPRVWKDEKLDRFVGLPWD